MMVSVTNFTNVDLLFVYNNVFSSYTKTWIASKCN